jgi:hypothetical protein
MSFAPIGDEIAAPSEVDGWDSWLTVSEGDLNWFVTSTMFTSGGNGGMSFWCSGDFIAKTMMRLTEKIS